ncbi:MAG: winged helix-turn-helix domain-containing protein [Pyrinomonadaceae bacterium]
MEKVENKKLVYQFGKFALHPQEKTLFADGVPLHLPAKEFETLLLLVENNGRALSKEEMMTAVWQDAFVEEGNLVKQISRLRKIFNANGEKLIETVPKHGYRFTADLHRTLVEAEPQVILEKRTVQRVRLAVDDEIDPKGNLLLPPKRQRLSRKFAFALLVLMLFFGAGLVWFWLQPNRAVKAEESGMLVLTDGTFDDEAPYRTNQGQIYFLRYVTNTRTETWQMNADGSEQRRVINGRRSPDGTKIVSVKEGDNETSYLMDENGANAFALPSKVGNMDWSPDGSQFVYQSGSALEKSEIFLYTLKTAKTVALTDNNVLDADPSFSYDGKKIAFASFRDGNAEIYVMDADGSNVRRLTDHPAFDNYPVFSPDGTQIAFQSNRENERTEVYLQNLDNDLPPVKIAGLNGNTGIIPKCWSADGTQILLYNNQNGNNRIFLSNVEAYRSKLILSDEYADLSSPRLSPDGQQMLYEARLADESGEFRMTNLETRATVKIFQTEPNTKFSHLPVLAPGGEHIAFTDKSTGNSEIFIINIDGSGLQNLTNDPLPDTNPVFSPDGNKIIFTRDFYGTGRLYRMNLDGSDQHRVTEKEGYEMTPAFSPDGSVLAFAGDRVNADSQGLDIFLLDAGNPANEKRLTARRFHESSPVFSPDVKRIAFIAGSDGNAEIYLMNADGTGLFRLTHTEADEGAPQFTADGKKLIFAGKRGGKSAIYEIELPIEVVTY